MILCLDPGAQAAGVALFENNGILRLAFLAQGKNWQETADALFKRLGDHAILVTAVALERMQVYDDTPPKYANDLITLSLMAGRVTGFFLGAGYNIAIKEYLPREWKGGVPKEIMTNRIKGMLTQKERDCIEEPRAKSLMHNVYDGVGIGIFHTRGRRALGW
jgi:hypothetical protein